MVVLRLVLVVRDCGLTDSLRGDAITNEVTNGVRQIDDPPQTCECPRKYLLSDVVKMTVGDKQMTVGENVNDCF
jgi:hypothetical protein